MNEEELRPQYPNVIMPSPKPEPIAKKKKKKAKKKKDLTFRRLMFGGL